MLTREEFDQVELRVGTVTAAKRNRRARIPAYDLTIDFGPELGVKHSSAQITDHYQPEDLVGRQVLAVTNFAPMRIGDVKSEARVLGASTEGGYILANFDQPAPNGARVM